MFQVQLFAAASVPVLQQSINQWLHAHKDAVIVHSNISTITQGGTGGDYIFYVLYTTTGAQTETLKELAAELQPAQSVEAADINPDVLEPSS